MFNKIFLANNSFMEEKIQAFPKGKEKISIKTKWFIFIIVILSALLLIESAFLFTDYYKQRVNLFGNIPIGREVVVNLNSVGAFATSISYDGTNIPGATIKQNVKINLPLQSPSCVVRAKVYTCDEGGNITQIQVTVADEVWLKKDEFYYYNDVFTAGVTTAFCQSLTLPTDEDFFNIEKYYEIIILFETLLYDEGSYNFKEIWTNIPDNWLINI